MKSGENIFNYFKKIISQKIYEAKTKINKKNFRKY